MKRMEFSSFTAHTIYPHLHRDDTNIVYTPQSTERSKGRHAKMRGPGQEKQPFYTLSFGKEAFELGVTAIIING